MNSAVITFILSSIVVALLGYFLLPPSLFSANTYFAFGAVASGIIGAIATTFSASGSEQEPSKSQSTTLYVGNLPYRANEQAVKDHFANYGKVFSVRLMKDRRTGKRKGYGFIEMASKDADKVISSLNDSEFQERTLKVRLAREKSEE